MQFGTTKTTKVLDDNGSTVMTVENIAKGTAVSPVRRVYEIKTRVHDRKQEQEVYIAFSDDLSKDKTKLDPSFRIEHTRVGDANGYYYVVNCYTQLEY